MCAYQGTEQGDAQEALLQMGQYSVSLGPWFTPVSVQSVTPVSP